MKTKSGDIGELEIFKILNGINEEHLIINNLMLLDKKNKSHQIDHIYINHKGIFVIETKNYYGTILSNDNDSIWIKVVNGKKQTIANPMYQNMTHIRMVKSLLKPRCDVISVVVFAKDNAPYMPDDNVINKKDLALFIDSYPNISEITSVEMTEYYKALLINESDISMKKHLSNIKEIKTNRVNKQKEIKKAIQSRICPLCKSQLEYQDGELYCLNKDCKYKIKI